jgi:hypothetical protein
MSNLSTFKAPLISGPVGTHGSSSAVPVLTLDSKGHLAVNNSPFSATSLSQFANDAGFLTQAGVRSAISVTGSLSYNASTGVISFAFDPFAKMDKAGGTFTGPVYFPGPGTNGFETGNGDAATYATHNVKLRMHNGLALTTYDGTVQGVWDSRAASLYVKGQLNGASVYASGAIQGATQVAVPRTSTTGGIHMVPGNSTNSGYVEFWPAGTGARLGYIGYGEGTTINLSAEIGSFNFVGNAPKVAGNNIWHAGNFNPASYAVKSADVTFRDVQATRGDGTGVYYFAGRSDRYLYFDSSNYVLQGANLFVNGAQVMTTANAYDKATGARQDVNNIPSFNAAAIDVVRGGVLRMRWTVDGSGNMIMQNGDSGDNFFYVNTGGAVWTKQFGDLNTRIENRASAYASERVAKTGDTMTGNLTLNYANPLIQFFYGGVMDGRLWMGNDAVLRWSNVGNDIIRIGSGGTIWTAQFGDLNQRIEDRAYAWAATRQANLGFTPVQQSGGAYQQSNKIYIGWDGSQLRAQVDSLDLGPIHTNLTSTVLIDLRMTYAGDLGGSWSIVPNYGDPYGGGVVTGHCGTPSGTVQGLRYRYLQKRDGLGNWYTVAYA